MYRNLRHVNLITFKLFTPHQQTNYYYYICLMAFFPGQPM